jgi:hypothetical protein
MHLVKYFLRQGKKTHFDLKMNISKIEMELKNDSSEAV